MIHKKRPPRKPGVDEAVRRLEEIRRNPIFGPYVAVIEQTAREEAAQRRWPSTEKPTRRTSRHVARREKRSDNSPV
jgi:hypothetical protein